MFPHKKPHSRKTLLQVQKQMLDKILDSSDAGPSWKILVFDTPNRNIVSSHLKMKDLRDHNITLYLSIAQAREQIHGVTILYLVQPTLENVQTIAEDIVGDLYTSVHIHFSSEPSANILSTLAKKITQHSTKVSLITRIAKIQYSCLNYFSIDHSMVVLPTEIEIVNLVKAMSLTPVFIFNPKNEESRALVDKIKNKLQSISTIQDKKPSSCVNYAIFYICNRENDTFPMLAHGITYASLLENMYRVGIYGNKLHYDKKGAKDQKSAELSLQDEIWLEKKNCLISEMGLDKESNKIKSKMVGKSNDEFSEMSEKSNKIEWHVNNASEMITQAKQRRLRDFYDIEKQIYAKGLLSKDSRRDIGILLRESTNNEDKVRLMMIYMHYMENLDELEELQSIFAEIKKVGKYNELKEKRLRGVVEQSATNKYLKKFAKGIWKNWVSDDKKFTLTKQLERIKNADFSEIIEAGLTVECSQQISKNIKINRNIVYCLGGICFHEYANLIENDLDCIYSGDKMVSYRDIL